jgi:hypothetical protein
VFFGIESKIRKTGLFYVDKMGIGGGGLMSRYKLLLTLLLTVVFLTCATAVACASSHDLQNLAVTQTVGGNSPDITIQFDLDNDHVFHAGNDWEWYTIEIHRYGQPTITLLSMQSIPVPGAGSHVSHTWNTATGGLGNDCGTASVAVFVYEDDIEGYYMEDQEYAQFSFDNKAPTISGYATNSPGDSGWYSVPAIVRFYSQDYYSGLDYPADTPTSQLAQKDVSVSTSGSAVSVTEHATDKLGNTAYYTVSNLKIDMVKPVIGIAVSPSPNAAGWFKTPVTVTFTASDALSGIESSGPDSATLSTEGASVSTSSSATDKAGNSNTVTYTAKIDWTSPHTTVALSGTVGSNGWYTSNVVMTLSSSDGTSGVKQIEYSTNGGMDWTTYSGPVTFSSEGTSTVQYRSVDYADNVEVAHSVSFKIDRSNPVITATLTPSPNMGGWNNGNVVVHFAPSDSVSGVASVTPDQTVTTEGYHQSVAGTVTDYSGRSASATALVSIDWTKPVTTCGLAGVVGTNGWNTSNVVMTLTPSDGLSGISRTEYSINDGGVWVTYGGPVTFSVEGLTTVLYRSIDKADNVEDSHTVSLKVDKTAPFTTCGIEGIGDNGWFRTDVLMTLTPFDSVSGIDRAEYSVDNQATWVVYGGPVAFDTDGLITVFFRSVDAAGNIETTQSVFFKVDNTAPITSPAMGGTRGDNGWFTSNVSVTLNALDNGPVLTAGELSSPSGTTSGVIYTKYRVDGGEWQVYSGSFPVNGNGSHLVQFNSTDLAGNRESVKSVTLNIDGVKPVSDILLTGTMGLNDWYVSVVNMSLTATDDDSPRGLSGLSSVSRIAVSGVSRIEYSTDDGASWETYTDMVHFSDDGPVTVLYRAVDEAGNVGDAGTVSFKVDLSKPVQLPSLSGSRSALGWFDSDVRLSLFSDDGMAGLSSVFYSLDNTTWLPYTGEVFVPLGVSRQVYYGGVDNAGNLNNGTVIVPFAPQVFPNMNDWQLLRQLEAAINGITPTPIPVPGAQGNNSNGNNGTTAIVPTTPTAAGNSTGSPTTEAQPESGFPMALVLLGGLVVVLVAGGVLYFFMKPK